MKNNAHAQISHPPVEISLDEAKTRFDLSQYDPLGGLDYNTVLVFEGDVVVQGNLDKSTTQHLLFGDRDADEALVVFDGNLIVQGEVAVGGYSTNLLVRGNLTCRALISMHNMTWVTGDAFIEVCYYGHYNDGVACVLGTTHVPLLFNSDHDSRMTPNPKTVCINTYGSDDDFFSYRHYAEDLAELFPDELFEWHSDVDFDFDWWSLTRTLLAGEPAFLDGKAPELLTTSEIQALAREA